jgi:Putative addiction module component
MMTVDYIESQVCSLGRNDKKRVLDTLIRSLDVDEAHEQAWLDEVIRRDHEITTGAVECIPLEQAMILLRQGLNA